MGAITIEEVIEGGHGSSGLTLTVFAPTVVNAGDLLVLAIATDGSSEPFLTEHADWTELDEDNNEAHGWVGYRIADGTEDGITWDFTLGSTETAVYQLARLSNWHGTTPPETTSAYAFGATGNADPPSSDPSWGAEDENLFIATMSSDGGVVTAAPSGYGTLFELDSSTLGGSGSCSVGMALLGVNAASENPGTFTNSSLPWSAQTIVVRPAAAEAAATPVPVHDFSVVRVPGRNVAY